MLDECSAQIFVFEDMKLKYMTASPAAKQDRKGCFNQNGAAAKAGLDKAMLFAIALGLVKQFTS
jgi:hypothetical protein